MAYITPNDVGIRAENDWQSIMNAIAAATAVNSENRVVRIPRLNARTGEPLWVLEKTILLPSDITILLDGCHLRLADGVMCNLFRNENAYLPIGKTSEGEQTGIHIIGQGNAVLDGGNHNGLTEVTMRQPGMPHVRNNNLILLINVSHYSLKGFRCIRMRYWAINQIFCRRGYVGHIDFDVQKRVRNQDGVNLRIGCSDILIEHITGQTGDDVVALTALPFCTDEEFTIPGRDVDIHDVTIRDVRANTHCDVVALRNADGAKLYRVQVENITDMGPFYPWGVVLVGESNYYKHRASLPGETYDITVRNVFSRANGTVFLGASLTDSHISGVYARGDAMYALSTYDDDNIDNETQCVRRGGVTMKNVVIENIHYNAKPAEHGQWRLPKPDEGYPGYAIDLQHMRDADTLENVVVRDVFTNGAEKLRIDPRYSLEIR